MMTAMLRRVSVVLIASGVLIAACGGSDDAGPESTTRLTLLPTTTVAPSTTSTTSTTTTTSTTSTTTTTVAAPATTEADPTVEELVLSGEGIGTAGFGADVLTLQTGGSARDENESAARGPRTGGGLLVAPPPLVRKLEQAKQASDLHTSTLVQRIVLARMGMRPNP